ncbi:MAG: tetratricopeptide repeat protein [Sphingomicrobium sp.]
MKIRPLFSAWRLTSLCAAALLVSACGNRLEIRRANDAYQQALALNDVGGQYRALLALTKADDGVSEYWLELARLDLELGAYGDAYAHFSRAHELDRTSVAPLSMMTELAVINGRVDLAEDHLEKLTVIAPNDRAVSVARGFTALRQGNFERAQENVDVLLAKSQRDSVANVLQSRIFVAQKKFPEAIDFLNRKLVLSADDRAMIRSLGAIHRYLGNWDKAAATDLKLWRLSPSNVSLAQQVVSDALHAKNQALASTVTNRVMVGAKDRDEVGALLSAWADLSPRPYSLSEAESTKLPAHSKLAFAHYLNRVGRPDQALIVLGGRARPLGDRANVDFNAVFAEALFLNGQVPPARQILDRILSDEPDDAIALSARARLFSRIGEHRGATIDAQRLVASYGTIATYRVLLAQIYKANRDSRGAERTLWDGYRDLPGDETLYEQVRRILAVRGDKDGLVRLKEDFDEERFSRLMKELA